jgi:uncharacterized protein YkwD
MCRTSLVALALTLTLAGCLGDDSDTGPVNPRAARDLAAVRLDPQAAAASLNAYRGSKGLRPTRLDPTLTAMAQRQADAMIAGNTMSHDVAGSFPSRLAASGLDATEAGENLGEGYYSLQDAMSGWRNSPEHDANLLMANATRLGIAIAKDPRTHYGVYWAMELAADPRPHATEPGLLTSSSGAPVVARP